MFAPIREYLNIMYSFRCLFGETKAQLPATASVSRINGIYDHACNTNVVRRKPLGRRRRAGGNAEVLATICSLVEHAAQLHKVCTWYNMPVITSDQVNPSGVCFPQFRLPVCTAYTPNHDKATRAYTRRCRINCRGGVQTEYDSNLLLLRNGIGVDCPPRAYIGIIRIPIKYPSTCVHVQVLLVPCIVTLGIGLPDESSRTGNAASASE